MGPKRAHSRTPESSSNSSQSGDNVDFSKFVSLDAQIEHYCIVAKLFVRDRGLKPDAQDGQLVQMIKERCWHGVCSTPMAAPMAIVREFYANAKETMNGFSFIRGA